MKTIYDKITPGSSNIPDKTIRRNKSCAIWSCAMRYLRGRIWKAGVWTTVTVRDPILKRRSVPGLSGRRQFYPLQLSQNLFARDFGARRHFPGSGSAGSGFPGGSRRGGAGGPLRRRSAGDPVMSGPIFRGLLFAPEPFSGLFRSRGTSHAAGGIVPRLAQETGLIRSVLMARRVPATESSRPGKTRLCENPASFPDRKNITRPVPAFLFSAVPVEQFPRYGNRSIISGIGNDPVAARSAITSRSGTCRAGCGKRTGSSSELAGIVSNRTRRGPTAK